MQEILLHIETEPLELAELLANAPEFKAAANLKDPAKIAEDIQKKKDKYISEAQYNESSARICLAAIRVEGKERMRSLHESVTEDGVASEEDLLFWLYSQLEAAGTVSFRGNKFVYPFICRRALRYGLNFFHYFYSADENYRLKYFKHKDIAQIWSCGSISHPESLDEIASVLGLPKVDQALPFYKMVAVDANAAFGNVSKTLDLMDEIYVRL